MIVESVSGARRTLRKIVPGYFRLFIPSVKGVGICYTQPGSGVEVSGDGAADWHAELVGTDELGRNVHCVRFNDMEKGLTAESLLTSSAAWQPIFLSS